MKTTVEISDWLFKETKHYAGERGISFRVVLETALRAILKTGKKKRGPFHLRKHPFGGSGLAEGLIEGDWSSIRERTYEGRGG